MAREVDVVVTNSSSTNIDAVEIYFKKHFVLGPHCFVGKGFSKTYKDYPHATAERVIVEWTADGKSFRKQVVLTDTLPKAGDGRLIFLVTDDAVSARFEKKH